MIGMIGGKLAGLVNAHLGAALFYDKAFYAFEILGQNGFWSTY